MGFARWMLLATWCFLPAAAAAQHEIDPQVWIEMRKLRPREPMPPVAEDVAALAQGRAGAKRAGIRLLERGPEVLPALHAALLAPETGDAQRATILQLLRAFSDVRSVEPLIRLAERDPRFRSQVLGVLAFLPRTDGAAAYARGAFEEPGTGERERLSALVYFGMQRDPAGRALATPLADAADPRQRAVALYVLARLGERAALEPITALFAAGAPAESRGVLLLGLAELVGPAEFETRAPDGLEWMDRYQEALAYAGYRTSQGEARLTACRRLLRAELPAYMRLGVRCLLEAGREDELLPLLALDFEVPARPALLRNELRKAGYRLIDREDEFRIVPSAPPATLPPG